MDGNRFDDLARTLAHPRTRRSLVRALAGTAAGGLLAVVGADRAQAKPGGNSAAAAFCHAVFGDTRAAGQCTSQAAHGTGPYVACGGNPANFCAGACTDVATDVANCGACGTACPSDTCNDGVCAGGACATRPKADGTPCDDGNPCTVFDVCQAGACVGISPLICTALDQCHVPGTCDPNTGTCSNPAAPDGTACDDGDACTFGDVCTGGVCAGTPAACSSACPSGSCSTAGQVCGSTFSAGLGCCYPPGTVGVCTTENFDTVCCEGAVGVGCCNGDCC
jgi:hypothetical protein